jgi:hypothetical protein
LLPRIYARQGYQEPRKEFFVYVTEREEVLMNSNTFIPYGIDKRTIS